jgi:cell division protein FtsB
MVFTNRVRRGLVARVTELAQQLAQTRLAAGLFPSLERECGELRLQREQLEALVASTAELRREIAASHSLGAPIRPAPIEPRVLTTR